VLQESTPPNAFGHLPPSEVDGETQSLRPGRVAAALRRRGIPGVGLLESGLDLDGLGRYSFLGARPLAVAVAEAGQPLQVIYGPQGVRACWLGDPLQAAQELLEQLRPAETESGDGFPFSGGAFLTLSYDLGRRYEQLPASAQADHLAPDLHLAVYDGVVGFDHQRGEVRHLGDLACGVTPVELAEALVVARAEQRPPVPPPLDATPPSTFDAEAYRQAVQRARELIRRGDLFEVNLSRRYALEGVDPDGCYARMRELSPAPFMADLELSGDRRLLSASPERFLELSAEGRATSWPIKGTRPRGQDAEQDAGLREELLACQKEAAELAMIVDLVRNDLGRVATPGSVRVRDPRRVQSWPSVHHTVAVVEAQLEPGRTWADLVRASFPPCSVTGAPKVRAMEVIDELEPLRRGLYCGAFGWVGWDGALDLAVGIRVVSCEPGRALIHAGGAVLLDSDPAAEEREAKTKAEALLRAAAAASSPSSLRGRS
jgi:para-aminobenzoate synthetase component I